MGKRKSTDSKSTIAKYWLIDLIPSLPREEVLNDPFLLKLATIDPLEPQCWACGRWGNNESLKKNSLACWNTNTSYLQKCHIVPHALGGSPGPENILLLCSKCHRECCDIVNPKYMKKMVAEMPDWIAGSVQVVEKYMEMFSVTEQDVLRILLDEQEDFIKFWSKSTITHGIGSYSTFIGAMKEYMETKQLT